MQGTETRDSKLVREWGYGKYGKEAVWELWTEL